MTGKDLDLENLPNDDEEQWENINSYWINVNDWIYVLYHF